MDILSNADTPFIIWTLRRAGGTNLAEALFNSSNCETVEHEPFNGDRVFGYVVKQWLEQKNEDLLYSQLKSILSKRILVKHCLEIIPHEVNVALIEVSMDMGYKHLFLYREYPTDRLLSLNYSQKTRIWGKEHRAKITVDEAIFDQPINIRALIDHELHCRSEMDSAFTLLSARDYSPAAVSFEGLYQSDTFEYSKFLVLEIYKYLGISQERLNDAVLFKMLRKGSQGTSHEYKKFKKSEELIIASDGLPLFSLLDKKVNIEVELAEDFSPLLFEIWNPLPSIKLNEYIIQGVCLSGNGKVEAIKAVSQLGEIDFCCGLRSSRVGGRFPAIVFSENSRFLASGVMLEEKYSMSIYFSDESDIQSVSFVCSRG